MIELILKLLRPQVSRVRWWIWFAATIVLFLWIMERLLWPSSLVASRWLVPAAFVLLLLSYYLQRGFWRAPLPPRDLKTKIVVVGAGPAGLSAAYFLRQQGYREVLVLAKQGHPGGLCRTITEDYRSFDLGANYVTPAYRETLNLADMVGAELYVERPLTTIDLRAGNASPRFVDPWSTVREGMPAVPYIRLCLKYIWLRYRLGAIVNPPGHAAIHEHPELCVPFSEWLERSPQVLKRFGFTNEERELFGNVKSHSYALTSFTTRNIEMKEPIAATLPLPEEGMPWAITKQFADSNLFQFYSRIPRDMRALESNDEDDPKHKSPLELKADRSTSLLSEVRAPSNESRDPVRGLIVAKVREVVERLNGSIEEDQWHTYDRWNYFQHVTAEAMRAGFYRDLESLQGKRRTYYTGALLNFELVEMSIAYSKHLIQKEFREAQGAENEENRFLTPGDCDGRSARPMREEPSRRVFAVTVRPSVPTTWPGISSATSCGGS